MAGRLTNLKVSFDPINVLILSIVISVASFARFYLLEEKLVFNTDQGRALLAARNILHGSLTTTGPETSLAGFHLGPFYYYLSAIPLWLADYHPIGPAVMTALFGVATSCLLFWYGKRYWGPASGIIMALAFALSPHATWQSRIAIEPAPLPFFSVLWLVATTLWLEGKNKLWLFGSLAVAILASQLNFSAIVLFALSLTLIWWYKFPQISFVWKKRGLIVFIATLLGLIIGHGLARDITSLGYFWRIWQQLTFPQASWLAVFWLVIFELVAWNILVSWRNKSLSTAENVLAAWFLHSLAGFLIKYVSGEHSLALLFPLPSIILGLSIAKLPILTKNVYLWASIPFLLLLMGFQSVRYLDAQNPLTIHHHQQVVNEIIELTYDQPYELIYRGHLDVYDAADDHYQYLLWRSGRAPVSSGRINNKPENAEKWLMSSSENPQVRVYLYSSLAEAERYRDSGPFVMVDKTALRFEDLK